MPPITPGNIHLTGLSGATLTLPSTIGVEQDTRTWRSHTARLADGREIHVAGPFPQPFDVYIRGVLQAADAAAARTQKDQLIAILQDAPLELRLMGSSDTRFVHAVPHELSRVGLGVDRWGALNVRLRSLEPFWVGDEVVTAFDGLTVDPTVRTLEDVAGNVPPNPIVTFTFTAGANTSNPKIINSSTGFTEFTVPGNFVAGDVLVVDTENMRVYDDNGFNYLDQMGDDFLLHGWPLALGDNTLNIYGSGTMRMDVDIAYSPRWM